MDHSAYKYKQMNQHIIHNLVWVPVFLIGVFAVILGILWFIHPTPWLIDQAPNEALIKVSFKDIFSHKINTHLPSYLIVLYDFFGLWLTAIGLLIIAFVNVTRLATKLSQKYIFSILIFILIMLFYLVLSFLPSSPIIFMLPLLTILLGCSIYFSRLLNEE